MASEESALDNAAPSGNKQKAEARVEINPEKTQALLCLRKGSGHKLDFRAVNHALKESDVEGYDEEKLKTDVQAFLQGNDTELDYVLAEGTPSTRGKDREIKIRVKLMSDEAARLILTRLKDWYKMNLSYDSKFEPQAGMSFAYVEKDELIANVSEASEGEDGKDIYGEVIPGLPGNDPDLNLSHGLLFHGSDITAVEGGLVVFQASSTSFAGEVFNYRDAKIGVHVSEDAMEVKATFFAEKGAGIPLTIENVKKVLSALGVKKGIEWEEVEKACIEARRNGSVLDYVIAKGETPIPPGGSSIKWLVDCDQRGKSFATGYNTITVRAGTEIVEISEPFAEGRPGYDVKGKALHAGTGTTPEITHDVSFKEERTEHGKRIVALRSGELSFDGQTLNISPIKTIHGDVAESVSFSGEIQIGGNVLPGCRIEGGSHITVDGFAEEAFIFAEGKAVVTRGFKGGGKGILKARAGISSAFVERASVMAIGDIKLEKGSILSNVITNETLKVLEADGKLQGGIYRARHGIDVADIGSEKGPVTEVSFGQDYFLKEQIDTTEDEISTTKQAILKLDEKIKEARNNKKPVPEEERIEMARLVKLLEQLGLKVSSLREKFEEHFESEVRVNGTVFPGVVIESHNRYYEIQQKRSGVIFYFDRESGIIKEKSMY